MKVNAEFLMKCAENFPKANLEEVKHNNKKKRKKACCLISKLNSTENTGLAWLNLLRNVIKYTLNYILS